MFSSKLFLLLILSTVGVSLLLSECQGNIVTNISINRFYYNNNDNNNGPINQLIERHYAQAFLEIFLKNKPRKARKRKGKACKVCRRKAPRKACSCCIDSVDSFEYAR